MIKEILIQNKVNSLSKRLRFDSEDICITEIDWGSPDIKVQTHENPYQIGITRLGVTVKDREIEIEGKISGSLNSNELNQITSWEEYYQIIESKIEDSKQKLIELINVEEEIRLYVSQNLYIDCFPERPVKFGVKEKDNNTILCKYSIVLIAFNPCFKETKPAVSMLSGVTPKFKFPLIFKKENPMVFGNLLKYKLLAIENLGDVVVGGIIKIRFVGKTINPIVYNVYTEEFIRIDTTIESGSEIQINTSIGSEEIELTDLEGNKSSLMRYLARGSTFLKFKKGTYLYGYSNENSDEKSMEVSISIEPQYYNFKEM